MMSEYSSSRQSRGGRSYRDSHREPGDITAGSQNNIVYSSGGSENSGSTGTEGAEGAASGQNGSEAPKGLFNVNLLKLLAAAFVIGCFVIIVRTYSDCAEKQKELDALNASIAEYTEENEELQRILDSDDLSGYMERSAVEDRGYAYPDEYRFYDTSRD